MEKQIPGCPWAVGQISGALIPLTVVPLDPQKPATDEEIAAWVESNGASGSIDPLAAIAIADVIRTRRIP